MNEFDLLAAKIELAKRDMVARLNAELFRYYGPVVAPKPLTWREGFSRRLLRARAYFETLGKALRGDDPYDVDHDY